MLRRCLHTLETGQRCNAPATDTSKYCRHHNPQAPTTPVNETEMEPIHLPLVIDRPSALKAINIILHAMGEGRLKRPIAGTFLSAIKLATRVITDMAEAHETLSPSDITDFRQMRSRLQPSQTDDRPAIALAAAGESRKPNSFSAARPFRTHETDTDPATARMLKEILAQSRDFPRAQQPGA